MVDLPNITWQALVNPHCPWCGLPLKDGDRHGVISPERPNDGITYACVVSVLAENPRRLGVLTAIEDPS
jgi:hypothetical protein